MFIKHLQCAIYTHAVLIRLIKEYLLNVCRVMMIQLYKINGKKPAPEKQQLQGSH